MFLTFITIILLDTCKRRKKWRNEK